MKLLLRNIAAVLVGLVAGSALNMGFVIAGPLIFPPPEGVDMADMDSLAESIHLLGPKNFVFPFLAHALGTLFGAWVAHLIGAARRSVLSYVVGALFLVGGIMAATMIPSPTWFLALDLLVAYLPMAWLATRLGFLVRPAENTPASQT